MKCRIRHGNFKCCRGEIRVLATEIRHRHGDTALAVAILLRLWLSDTLRLALTKISNVTLVEFAQYAVVVVFFKYKKAQN